MSIIKVLDIFLYIPIVSMNEIILLGRALVSIGAWSGYPCSNVLVSEVFILEITTYVIHHFYSYSQRILSTSKHNLYFFGSTP